MKRILPIIILLAAIIALPMLMRQESATAKPDEADERLIIITPHNESIRSEFGEAFARYWKAKTGKSVYVDWRTPGGTVEIRKVLDSGYEAAKARGAEGIGIDIFFGGGDYEFIAQQKLGRLEKLDVFQEHPEWFNEQNITQTFSGERYYNDEKTWVACCLSQFGICYNIDVLQRLGIPAPTRWSDLANPKYIGNIAMADPSKSGSVARAFELILQQTMQENIAAGKSAEEGWAAGWQLILQLCANARYFTDSASKIPQDIAQGDSAAGMCVDFYGRSFSDEVKKNDGTTRLKWIAPQGGTSLSGDPIAILKGASNKKLAEAFIEFVLSDAGQILWNATPRSSANAPLEKSLRRMPIRRSIYTAENLTHFADPVNPYDTTGTFVYKPELTSKAFNTIRTLVKTIGIDSHEEMKHAWAAIHHSSSPSPTALQTFLNVSSLPYEQMKTGDPALDSRDKLLSAKRAAQIGENFRHQYQQAEKITTQTQH